MSSVTVMEFISLLMIVVGLAMVVFDFRSAHATIPIRLQQKKRLTGNSGGLLEASKRS